MAKNLTTSTVSRQNILNNNYALEKIKNDLSLGAVSWRQECILPKHKWLIY
jgi:hypothetical protein